MTIPPNPRNNRKAGPIFLVGARAAGKSTLGKALAADLRLSFTDTDELIVKTWLEQRAAINGETIAPSDAVNAVADIVAAEGWEGFRRRECLALREAALGRRVVATGGGAVLAPENRELMRRSGLVIYLHAPAAVLAARIGQDANGLARPSLTGLSPELEMDEILAARDPLYRETACHIVDARAAAAIVLQELSRIARKL